MGRGEGGASNRNRNTLTVYHNVYLETMGRWSNRNRNTLTDFYYYL